MKTLIHSLILSTLSISILSIHIPFTQIRAGETVKYYPSIPIYESSNIRLLEIKKTELLKLKKTLSKYNIPFKPTYETEDSLRFILNLKNEYKLRKSGLDYKLIDYKHAAFTQYQPSYHKYIVRGLESLDDLTKSYKDLNLNYIFLKQLSEKYPELVTFHIIGKTRLGNPIPAISIEEKNSVDKVSVLINGAHHSNELISTEHCYDIIYSILSHPSKYKKYLTHFRLWFVPIVNPDGSYFFWHKSLMMGRKNGYLPPETSADSLYRGVDLNRNYPFQWNTGQSKASSGQENSVFFRGKTPGSEPETKTMMWLSEQERFLFSLSFHSFATCILYPYSIEEIKNPEPDYVKNLAERMADAAISMRQKKRFIARKNIYPVDGTDQDYFYFQYGTNALLVESSHHNPPYRLARKVMEGFREVWEMVFNEYIHGIKIILKITDEDGKPLSAIVKIKEIQTFEGESHTSHPKTGLFTKMVLEEKSYNLSIKHPGYHPKEIRIKASDALKAYPI
ncbi:MAG: peptidase M14, partial [Leptospiraceae bacterium]|nr:peptidase M14 [Leptospiraceae bacterium]